MEKPVSVGRIPLIDVARGYGMFLVYYGHIVERILQLKSPVAVLHYKCVYSFHMVFFFLLAGYVLRPEGGVLPVRAFVRKLAASRLAPYVFFCLLFMIPAPFLPGWFPAGGLGSAADLGKVLGATFVHGFPILAVPIWFLGAIITVEVLHWLAGRFLDTGPKLLVAAVVFYVGGFYLSQSYPFLFKGSNYWLAHEAPLVYSFYLLGIYLRRSGFLLGEGAPRRGLLWAGALACALVVLLTFNLNKGPFKLYDAVVIVLSFHGNIFWFPFTAIVGSVMLLLFARAVSPVNSVLGRFTAFLGANALVVFCLNSFFYHYVNGPVAGWIHANLPDTHLAVLCAAGVGTFLSLVACVPVVLFLNRYLPQLVGKPRTRGPILPNLL